MAPRKNTGGHERGAQHRADRKQTSSPDGTHLVHMMERLVEDVSFHAARRTGETITIDAAFVDERLAGIAGDDNLSRYIL